MKKYFLFAAVSLLVLSAAGCGSSSGQAASGFPSVDESNKKIAAIKPRLDTLHALISSKAKKISDASNIITRIRIDGINKVISPIAQSRLDDIIIKFLETKPIWKEDKSTLGISYTNSANIESGEITVDLKKFEFIGAANNVVDAEIEIEGSGQTSVSGKFAGVSATATPRIHFYLKEVIPFAISADSLSIVLTPQPKPLILKAKVTLQLLQFQIPFSKEIALQSTDILKPVQIPAALQSEISMPVVSSASNTAGMQFEKRKVLFSKAAAHANFSIIEIQGNVDISK